MSIALTPIKKELLDLFFNTKTSAKVLRRKGLSPGSYQFYDIVRETRPIDFPVDQTEFALKIHEVKPDASLSPYYINLRNLPEELLDRIADVLAELRLKVRPDFCTGIPKTAVTMAQKYASVSKIPFVDLFEKTGTDTDRKIEVKSDAPAGGGRNIIIIDDVVSQARSKFEAIAAAQKAGYNVVGILVLVDREQGGAREMKRKGYTVYSVFKISSIMRYYLQSGKIKKDQYNKVVSYLKAGS